MRNKFKHRANTQIKERPQLDMTVISDAIHDGKLKTSNFDTSLYSNGTKRTQDNTTQRDNVTSQGATSRERQDTQRDRALEASRNQTAEAGTSRMSRNVGADSVH